MGFENLNYAYMKSPSCSAQQRTAANATKKRVMPNQVICTPRLNRLHPQQALTPLQHHSSCFLLLFFFFCVLAVTVSVHLSYHCCPFSASYLHTLVCTPLSFLYFFMSLPLSPLLFLLFYGPGRDSCKYPASSLHLHLSVPLWVGGGVSGHLEKWQQKKEEGERCKAQTRILCLLIFPVCLSVLSSRPPVWQREGWREGDVSLEPDIVCVCVSVFVVHFNGDSGLGLG